MSTININMPGSSSSIGGAGSTGGTGFADALTSLTEATTGGAQKSGKKDPIAALLEALEGLTKGGQDNKQSMGDYQNNCPCCKACG